MTNDRAVYSSFHAPCTSLYLHSSFLSERAPVTENFLQQVVLEIF